MCGGATTGVMGGMRVMGGGPAGALGVHDSICSGFGSAGGLGVDDRCGGANPGTFDIGGALFVAIWFGVSLIKSWDTSSFWTKSSGLTPVK